MVLILALAVSVTLIDYSTGDGTGTTPGTGQAQPVSPSAPAIDRTRVDNLLNAHAAALLAGDEQGWLDVADPARPGVVAWYRQLYTTLKALRVTWFDYRVPEEIAGGRPGPRPENVSVEYCLAGVTCDRNSSHATAPMQLQFTERGGRWWVTDVADRADGWKTALNPPPWLADTLHVRCQGAVIVAASPALAGRVDSIAAAADRAAAVTNRYIRPTGTPPTYLIYLAGPAQCETWHDRPAPPRDSVAGVAVASSSVQVAVILNMELIDRDDLDEVLRHELGHVATLFGEPDDKNLIWPPPQHDWAAEGVAEYIAWAGQPRAAYPRLDDIRTYVRADRWNGSLPVNIDKADRLSASATYGLNYLVIRYLADRYGEPAMLRLIDDLLRNHKTADNATRASLGQPWATIATDLTTHLRNIAS